MTPEQIARHNGEACVYPDPTLPCGRDGTLSKRELFAAKIAAGLAPAFAQGNDFMAAHVAKGAVEIDDALLVELQRPREVKAVDVERVLDRPTAAKDVARYEWLRVNFIRLVVHTSCSPTGRAIDLLEVSEHLGQDLDPGTLDRAIDTAIAREEEKRAQSVKRSEQEELL